MTERTMREIREIVKRDRARWNELGELWDDLTYAEQDELLAIARKRAAVVRDPDGWGVVAADAKASEPEWNR